MLRLSGRLVALSAASAILGTSLLVATASSASAASADYEFLSKVNAARSDHGLKALTMVSDLHSIATSWSTKMSKGDCAGDADICHNPNLTSQVHNWQAVGENVGVGPNVDSLEDAFMNSPEHRANILDSDYTEIGIGTAVGKDGRLYVTQDFRQPMHSSSSSGSSSSSSSSAGSSSGGSSSAAPAPRTTSSVPAPTSGTTSAVPATPVAAPTPTIPAKLRHAGHAHHARVGNPVAQAMWFAAALSSNS